MIFKKPYAFLIKQFRIIHIILVFLAVYILNQTSDVYTFFSNYISNGYSAYITDDLSTSFVNFELFLLISLMVGLLVVVGGLLAYKKKKDKIYAISLVYYILLIVFFVFYYTVFNSMEDGVITANSARIYNDVALMFYLPQYILVAFYSVRALGFNVKQFNFKNDLKEMDLAEEDSEEVELNIEFDTYKAKRGLRRFIREMKYYIRENLIFFIIICGTLVFMVSYNIISNLAFFNNNYYDMGSTFYYDGFYVTFDNVVVTNTDEGGDIISEGKYFLVMTLTLENSTTRDLTVDINDFRLLYNGVLVTPSNEYSSLFSDFGSSLLYSTIKYSSSGTYVVVYEIDEEDINDDFELKLFTGTYTSGDVIYPLYSVVDLSPTILIESSVKTSYQMSTTVNFSNTTIGASSFVINSYEISDLFYYDYEKCVSDVCSTYLKSIYIDYGTSSHRQKTILAIDSELILDETTLYYSNNKSYYSFFNNFVKIEYVIAANVYTSEITAISTSTGDGKYYLLIPEAAEDADLINLIITIRNQEYIYVLK